MESWSFGTWNDGFSWERSGRAHRYKWCTLREPRWTPPPQPLSALMCRTQYWRHRTWREISACSQCQTWRTKAARPRQRQITCQKLHSYAPLTPASTKYHSVISTGSFSALVKMTQSWLCTMLRRQGRCINLLRATSRAWRVSRFHLSISSYWHLLDSTRT